MGKLDDLTIEGRDVQCALSDAMLSRVADLVLRLHQDKARQSGAVLPPHMLRSYAERPETEREGMRSACRYMVVALVLLGIIDAPDL
jgi:hypothetical protein